MKASNVATRSWSNVSGDVWLPKGTSLKGIMFICRSVVNKKFYSTSLIPRKRNGRHKTKLHMRIKILKNIKLLNMVQIHKLVKKVNKRNESSMRDLLR